MAKTALRHFAVELSDPERLKIVGPFDNRDSFITYCRSLANRQLPYMTLELRERNGGTPRLLWHPCETRFFDPDKNGGR